MCRRSADLPKCNCSASTKKERSSRSSIAITNSYHDCHDISLELSFFRGSTVSSRSEPMTVMSSIGTIAAICTTGAFAPQIVKIRRQGGKDLSYLMLFVYL